MFLPFMPCRRTRFLMIFISVRHMSKTSSRVRNLTLPSSRSFFRSGNSFPSSVRRRYKVSISRVFMDRIISATLPTDMSNVICGITTSSNFKVLFCSEQFIAHKYQNGISFMLKIAMSMDMTIKPTTSPMTRIITGSRRLMALFIIFRMIFS